MSAVPSLFGQVFGRWTVLDSYVTTAKGERKWACRCECGTERYVLERSLKSGNSLSCGCLRKEQAQKAAAHNLEGMGFGHLTVIRKIEKENKSRGLWWECRCDCGNTCEVLATLLFTGRKTHCGCKTDKTQFIVDIKGRIFGRLTALYPTDKRDSKGYVLWHCKCSCGKDVNVSYNELLYSNVKSCGCLKKEHDQALQGYLNHIDGTLLEILKSTKVPTNNTTGYKGVYFINSKYVAKITFQKKTYYLGSYSEIQEAVEARKEAEKAIFQTALSFYVKWQERAKHDPQWAQENPVSVKVMRDDSNRLYLEMLPGLE